MLAATYNINEYSQRVPELRAWADNFIDSIDVQPTTKKGYRVCLDSFLRYLDREQIEYPTHNTLLDYKRTLEEGGYSAGTMQQYVRALKQFFSWTDRKNFYPNVAEEIKSVKVRQDNTKKEAFSEEDMRTILNSIDTSTVTGKRDYAMILLSVTGGLRIIEMQRAEIGDIQTIKGQKVLYIQGKGRKEKDEYVKLVPEVFEAIDSYLRARGTSKRDAPLFAGEGNRSHSKKLTEPSMSRIIKNVFIKAGYDCDKLTAHSLRHTSNTLLFKSGADLYAVQKHARHSDPKTTEIYLHAVERESDKSEALIFQQIFNPDKKNYSQLLSELIEKLSDEDNERLFSYAKRLYAGVNVE